ncbi:MAG: ABC transporter permease [Spirochaetales bacterium]|nr:ABC transporter permease [Spirochaetales bacterium]
MSNTGFSFPVIHDAIDIMTPFLLAGIGGLVTELSGMLNIALEGLILLGAFFSVIFASITGSLFLGLLFGVITTMFIAFIFGAITIYLKANEFITAIAVNLLATGLTAVISFHFFGTKGNLVFDNFARLPVFDLPALDSIPIIGDIFLGHNIIVYAGWLLVFVFWFVLYKTPYGLRLRGVGLNFKAMSALGLNPKKYRLEAIVISGFTCALAGASLSLNIGAYVPNISSGRGWIALVVIYLGGRTPLGILIASFIFALAESFSNYAQGFINIPADFILAFPYIITVVALVLVSAIKKRQQKIS